MEGRSARTMRRRPRLAAALLAVALAAALAAAGALAVAPQRALAEAGSLAAGLAVQQDGVQVVATGYCTANKDALWELDSEGTLTFTLKEGATNTVIGGTNAQGPLWANDIEWNGEYRGKGVTSGHPSITDVKHVVVSDGITGVKSGYFCHLRELRSVQLPEGITSMTGLFQECNALESVNVPSTVTSMAHCFVNCSSLADVDFAPNSSLASLGTSSFESCRSLEYIDLPMSIVQVGLYAFKDCKSLKSINWPTGCRTIPESCFMNCSSLESFDCPEGVVGISFASFRYCTSLERVSLPATCTSIAAVGVFL